MTEKLKRRLLIVAGTISTVIGVVGIFVPILPTTPFLLLAAACYLRSSQKFYCWLLNNRFIGAYLNNYLQGKGMPRKIKIITILLLWLTIAFSIFLVQNLIIRVLLLAVAIGVSTHILLIKTTEENRENRKGT